MSEYIELRSIDFKQVTVDGKLYHIEKIDYIDNKLHIIYKPLRNLKSFLIPRQDANFVMYFSHCELKEKLDER